MSNRKNHLLVLFSAFLLYLLSANLTFALQSHWPQYVYLANAFLHGRLDMIELPANTYDMILYQDHWYVPGALAPALLMLPFVAIIGTGFSDIFFGVMIGSINVLLMYSLLGQLGLDEKDPKRTWLTVLFAAGTVHWWVTSLGGVWFNAHSVAVLFLLLFVIETISDRHPWRAGLWLGLAALSRPPTMFAAIFFLVFALTRNRDWRMIFLRRLLPFGAMLALSVGVMMAYNVLRFGSPLEFGYRYVQGSYTIVRAIEDYGGFSPIFIPCNLYISLVGLPNLPGAARISDATCWHLTSLPHGFNPPFGLIDPRGMSIFLTTPAFFYLFRARWRDPLVKAAWAGTLAVSLVLCLYATTGWVQFGYRYILDAIPFVMILIVSGMPTMTRTVRALIIASVLINLVGFLIMFQFTYGLFPFGL